MHYKPEEVKISPEIRTRSCASEDVCIDKVFRLRCARFDDGLFFEEGSAGFFLFVEIVDNLIEYYEPCVFILNS